MEKRLITAFEALLGHFGGRMMKEVTWRVRVCRKLCHG